MASAYEDALGALYRVPLDVFVAERKRLATELKTAGDVVEAARLAKLTRPSIAAWAVNQLFWHERRAFHELFATAERLRKGAVDADAMRAYREAIDDLRARAATLLRDAGKSASEATLRSITGTLSAVAAAGGFDPDPPGGLTHERDPVGFDVRGLIPAAPARRQAQVDMPAAKTEAERKPRTSVAQEDRVKAEDDRAEAKRREAAAAAAEERRRAHERSVKKAERERVERELRDATKELEARSDAVARLEKSLADAADSRERSRVMVRDLEARLAELEVDRE